MQIIQKKIDELIPYENNTKKHDDTQIRNVAESIKQYGFVQPLVIDKDNVIVIGHCRYEASKTLGMEEVPCVLVDNLTEEQVKALRIVDNKTNESEWDMDILAEELDELDLGDFDFSFAFEDDLLEDIDTENLASKEPPINWLKVGKLKVAVTDEEIETIENLYKKYIQQMQTEYGFVRELCNGRICEY